MKKLFILLAAFFITATTFAQKQVPDTILLNLENGSKMAFYLKSYDDLQSLRDIGMDELVDQIDSTLAANNKYVEERKLALDARPEESMRITIKEKDDDQIDIKINGRKIITRGNDDDDDDDDDDDEEDSEEEKARKAEARKYHKKHDTDFVLDLGLNNYIETGGGSPSGNLKLSPLGSRYVSLGFLRNSRLGGKKSLVFAQYGLATSWNNFMFENDVIPEKSGDTLAISDRSPLGISYDRNKLTMFALKLPVSLGIRSKRNSKAGFVFTAGGFVGYRLSSYTKEKYELEGRSVLTRTHDDFYLNDWLYGVQTEIGWKHVRLFGEYHLNSLFEKDKGPELQTINFGIRFI